MKTKNYRYSKNDVWFLFTALIIPGIQFAIFYIFVNLNTIKLSFQTYTGTEFIGANFSNYKKAINDIFNDTNMILQLKNTFSMYFYGEILMLFVTVLISFAVWKKVLGFRFFSVMLFLPSIISGVVFVMIGRYMVMYVVPKLFNNPALGDLLNMYTTGFKTVLIYQCFLYLGTKIILLSGAMSSIDTSIVEYGELDGMNSFHQFVYIVFPHIFPTLISLFMLGCAGIFSNMGMLLAFYDLRATVSVKTIGYYIYLAIYGDTAMYEYSYISALGVILTIVVLVYSLTVKKLLIKFGPSEE